MPCSDFHLSSIAVLIIVVVYHRNEVLRRRKLIIPGQREQLYDKAGSQDGEKNPSDAKVLTEGTIWQSERARKCVCVRESERDMSTEKQEHGFPYF